MKTDNDFIACTDRVLSLLGDALDQSSDEDFDWSLNDGVLEIECPDGNKLIVNRHMPNRELWVAAKSGGFHFRPVDGQWRDSRNGEELRESLSGLLKKAGGSAVVLPPLPAPPAS